MATVSLLWNTNMLAVTGTVTLCALALRSDLIICISGICLDCKLFPPHYWFTTAGSDELAVALAAKKAASWLLQALRVLGMSSIQKPESAKTELKMPA